MVRGPKEKNRARWGYEENAQVSVEGRREFALLHTVVRERPQRAEPVRNMHDDIR